VFAAIRFQPIFDSRLLVGVVAAVLLLLLLLGPAFASLTGRQRGLLTGLRLVAVVAVILGMLRPTWYGTTTRPLSATLVLMLDQSRSMQVPDAPDGKTRWQAQSQAVRDALPDLTALAEDFEVKIYAFAAEARELAFEATEISLPDEPDGDETDIGSSLDDVLRNELGKRLAGIVLLSDGAQRAYAPRVEMQQAAGELVPLNCPLQTVAFGLPRDQAQARNLALADMQDEYRVFVKNELVVNARLLVEGYVNQGIPVELLVEDAEGRERTVDTSLVSASEDGQWLPISLRFTPQQPGQFKLTLRAAPQASELVTKDNQLSAFLTVLRGGLKVLYLEGELRHEYRFLRRSIDSSADIQLDALWIDRQQRDKWPVDLTQPLGEDYDVFLIGDLNAAALGAENLARLREKVSAGSGLMMIGGFHSFGPGGYGRSELADVLPILFDRFERQDFDRPPELDFHISGPVQMLPAANHFIVHLAGGEDNLAAWQRLRPLTGANRFAGVKGNALVLAENSAGAPLLVAGEYGAGRVLAFAGDSTWQWWLQSRQAQADHRRFWRQATLWLARKDGLEQNEVWLRLDQRRFHPQARVDFTAGARAASGDVIADAVLTAEVIGPDGKRKPAYVTPGAEQAVGTFGDTSQPGDYTIEVVASREGKPIGTARTKFLIFDQDLEMSDPSARPQQLAALSQITAELGGKLWSPQQLRSLLQQIRQQPPEMEIEVQTKWQVGDTPGDAWLWFLLVVGVLGTDWLLRKKWGLV
jgi:uncharacterized membrane protein